MYQTLYRKYRPSNFDEVVGQKVIIQTLKNAINNNTLSHAYLFTGPRGTGKTSIAKILAKTINCTELENITPCNKCVNCTQNNLNPLDIIEIDAASNNGVDEIRELKSKVNLVPALGKYKIYIIDEVHMLSTGAFNALLKTLEEPPGHVIFVLATTDPHKIPATILSRCQRFDFKRLITSEIVERMKYIVDKENIEITDEALNEIARLSLGGMRDALSLLDQAIAYSEQNITIEDIHEINGTITPNEQLEFIKDIISSNIESLLIKINDFEKNGKDFIKLTEEIILFLRNIIISDCAPNFYNETINYDIKIENIDFNKILNYTKELNNVINDMKNSNNPKILFELTIIKLLEPKKDIKKIRINNTLCNFNKKELLDFIPLLNKIDEIKENKYDSIKQIINNGTIKAVGKENIIILLEENSNEFNNNLELIDELFEKAFNKKYKLISVSIDEWEIIKKEFNNKEKKYEYIAE